METACPQAVRRSYRSSWSNVGIYPMFPPFVTILLYSLRPARISDESSWRVPRATSFYVSYGNDRQNEMAGGLVITFSCPITFISLRVVQLSRSQWRSGCRCGRASALANSRPRWILRHLSGNRITLIAIFDHEKITGRNGIMWSKMRCERD